MFRYLLYRKFELLGLLCISAALYLTYKMYSMSGIAVNPLTGKKSLTCLSQ